MEKDKKEEDKKEAEDKKEESKKEEPKKKKSSMISMFALQTAIHSFTSDLFISLLVIKNIVINTI